MALATRSGRCFSTRGSRCCAEIAIGPAVKTAVLQSGHIVRDEVAAELVPFVDRGPELAALRLPGEPDRIAQAGGKHPCPPRHRIDFEDRRPALFISDAVLTGVAVGPDGDVEMRAVWARDDVLGPMIIDGAGRQIGHLHRGCGDRRLPILIGKPQQGIGVGDIEVVTHQGHAEGRIEPGQEGRLRLGHAVAVGIAQQHDAIGARHAHAGAARDKGDDHLHDARLSIRPCRGVGLGDEHVAIRQDVQPAREVEAGGVGGDGQARGRYGLHALGPALGGGDVHGGNERLLGFGKLRIRPGASLLRQGRLISAPGETEGQNAGE